MKRGKIVTLSGISGIGKSFLKEYILKSNTNFQSLISVTTRSKRKGEVDGRDKFFYSLEKFEEENSLGKFCVVNKVYGNWYAYKKSQIDLCSKGTNLITELFYKNVYDFKCEFSNSINIYILPFDIRKTIDELRLRQLDKDDYDKRVKDINEELDFFYSNRNLFDIVIKNDYTERTCESFQQLLIEKMRS